MEKTVMIAFLMATSMVYQTLAQDDEITPTSSFAYGPSPSYEYDQELLHHMTAKRIKFLQDCSHNMSSKCGVEMTKGLINDKPVSEKCCMEFLKIGRDCHQGLMNFVFSTYELKDDAIEILPRSKKMWNTCVQSTAAKIGAPIAFES
ncbi:hypothetical protein CARUB_v10011939mg [Capsella rubella]|uniref:Prolamin-like domain-containing protein n=1 Tax=Capsella rubella TaxID=81985 RepID=R0GNT2_9BRAS|nr:protein DOWN-REGULATED IN DIF1 11 [Capsella rubella]EOA37587.1 hypothetical protein CARUB_v10011939mg [Capsella rubella]